jgi:polar amino acid transport system substrate-binding protein
MGAELMREDDHEITITALNNRISALEQELREQSVARRSLQQQLDEALSREKVLEINEKRYRVLVNNSEDAIYSCNLEGSITLANAKFCQLAGAPAEKIVGKEISAFLPSEAMAVKWKSACAELIRNRQTSYFEYEVLGKKGGSSFYQAALSPITNLRQETFGVIGVHRDITILKQHEQKVLTLAYRDSLTNLPNKILFADRLHTAALLSVRNGTKAIVFLLDVDDFQKINKSWGYSAGDKILKEIGGRLASCIRDSDTVARAGEDKFLLLFLNIGYLDHLFPIIERIKYKMKEPFDIQGELLYLTISMGIAVAPDDGYAAQEIMINADKALYEAKAQGGQGCCFFNEEIRNMMESKTRLAERLRDALRQEEFVLYFQPQYEASTRRLRGLEALIRWQNPEIGLVMPAEFIPLAEEIALIVPLGKWIIHNACQICAQIKKDYGLKLIVSVNIAAIQLRQSDFCAFIIDAVAKAGIEASNLELEIAESIFINNFEAVANVLKNLQAAGIRIVLDNFGTGGLPVSFLKDLPVNMVKLDKAFVAEIGPEAEQTDSQAGLVKSLIALVRGLDIEMTAEGVENQEQFDYFNAEKCDHIQGYFMAEPVPEDMLEEIIEKGILENEALGRLIQRAGLTYEGLLKWRKDAAVKNWVV